PFEPGHQLVERRRTAPHPMRGDRLADRATRLLSFLEETEDQELKVRELGNPLTGHNVTLHTITFDGMIGSMVCFAASKRCQRLRDLTLGRVARNGPAGSTPGLRRISFPHADLPYCSSLSNVEQIRRTTGSSPRTLI